jgi:hypothetical protein
VTTGTFTFAEEDSLSPLRVAGKFGWRPPALEHSKVLNYGVDLIRPDEAKSRHTEIRNAIGDNPRELRI